MIFQDDILNELQSISPLLAGLQKTTLFSVPDGYFENLGDSILASVKKETGIVNNSKMADVPEGYFENLSSAILNKIKVQQNNTRPEEPEVLPAALQNLQQINPFKTPQDYFENLSSTISNRIQTAQNDTDYPEILSESLQSLQQVNVFEVPGGYFENLPMAILNKIQTGSTITAKEEIKELSPLLQSLQQVNVFEVPAGYFSTVQDTIIDKIQTTSQVTGKVVSMTGRRSFLKYAAAAIFTGAMALGVYKYTDKPAAKTQGPDVSFIKLDPFIEKGKDMNEEQFNEALSNLTKEDITSYLEKNGNDEDISLLTNNMNDNELPNKDEYLVDEKTLENYLDKIKFQN